LETTKEETIYSEDLPMKHLSHLLGMSILVISIPAVAETANQDVFLEGSLSAVEL
jgi:hypothetical protein